MKNLSENKDIGTTFAFVVSLVGGLIITIFSILNVLYYSSGTSNLGGYGGYMRGMMTGNHNFFGAYGTSYSFLAGVSLLAVICGVIVMIGAILLTIQPHQHTIWAIVILAFSLVSFVGMGGYFIGATLGVIGAVFELSVNHKR